MSWRNVLALLRLNQFAVFVVDRFLGGDEETECAFGYP
jgi:hypothetical protein